jgi:erythromycin esterase
MRQWFPAASLLLMFAAACSQRGTAAIDDAADPAAWIRANGHEVALEADDFADLEFLRPLLAGKRVVQLGENTHGIREYNLVKARIVRFLHQELGYDVLAWESAVYQCYDADVTAATAAAVRTLTDCAYGTWHTRDLLPLFEYLRGTHHGARPLRLAGIDVQPIGRNKTDRPEFLAGIVAPLDSSYAREVFQLDSTFLAVYTRPSRERRAYYRADSGQRMADRYDRLEAFLGGHRDAAGPQSQSRARAVAIAQRTAASMAWYVRQQSAPTTREYVERRDEGMAENLAFLLDTLYPGRKVIVWGHNFHLRHDNLSIPPDSAMFPSVAARTMGSWTRERYGDSVYTIGLYAYRGSAADNGGEIYEIAPAEAGSLEALLHQAGARALFIDLSRAPRTRATAWMDGPLTARYNGTTPLAMVLRRQYDGILLVDSVTPRAMLQ